MRSETLAQSQETLRSGENVSQSVTKKNIGSKNGKTARQNALNKEQGQQNAISKSKKNPNPGAGAPSQKRPKPNM